MIAAVYRITSVYFITNVIKTAWLMSSNWTVAISVTAHLVMVRRLNFMVVLLFVAPATIMGAVYAAGPAIKFVPTISTHFICLT